MLWSQASLTYQSRDMSIFWVILFLVILFVVGSATALNALGRGTKPDKNKAKQEDKD